MKRLSSPFTFLQKIILPLLFIGFGFYELVRVVWNAYAFHVEFVVAIKPILLLVFWLGLVLLYACFEAFPMKKVYLEDGSLRVSNYFKEIRIPLLNVQEVKVTSYGSWKEIVVDLKEGSEFGRKIKFIPGFYYKNAVAEIKRAIEYAQART